MLAGIIRFEWRYHTRQISFVASVLLFLAAGYTLASTGFGPDNVHINSPYSIAESNGLMSLLSVFVLASFCGAAMVRDREHRMEEIVFTTSVNKFDFLLGRFAGSFLAALTAFSASAAGLLLGRFAPGHDPSRLGAVNIVDYLHALAVVALPNLLFAGVVLFAVAAITRSMLASYAASVVLYVLYFVAAAYTNSPLMAASTPGAEGSALAALLDPFALSAFFEQTQYWTAAERNTRMVPLAGNFLLNRLLWTFASLAGLALTYHLFAFRVSADRTRRSIVDVARSTSVPAQIVTVTTAANPWQTLASSTRLEIRAMLLNRPFWGLLLLWVALVTSEIIAEISGGELGSSFRPTTALLAATIRQPLSLIGTILLIYFSAESIWRERTLRVHEVLHATPARNAAFVLSKWIGLAMLSLALTAAAFAAVAAIQLANRYALEPELLASFALVNLVPLLLFAAMAVLIQTLSPQKYVGMILVLVFAVIAQRGEALGLEHPLLRFASATVEWSAFNGFGDSDHTWRWLMSYWSGVAGLALVVATAVWRPERRRFRFAPGLASAILLTVSGATIFTSTNVVHAYETSADLMAWKADYERTYESFARLPRPSVRNVEATIDLEPEARRYRVGGSYLLVNGSTRPIDTILVGFRRDAVRANVRVTSPARITHDGRFNHFVVRLQVPLAPGASTRVQFDVAYAQRGLVTTEADYTLVENGAYIMSFRSFPSIGYRTSYEIESPRERRRHGLAGPASRSDEADEIAIGDWTTFDVTVSTARDQTVVAPGTLARSWESAGRRFFRFQSDAPIPNQFAIASARYDVRREQHDGVTIEVYFHPDHAANVGKIMRAAADSLRLFGNAFGPYPHRHLRIAEVPLYWNFGGFAQPGVIFLQEQRAFLIDGAASGRFDLLDRRVAHEVAHQWWGHTLTAADAPGATMLTESLAKYAEMLAHDRRHGRAQTRRSLAAEHDLYLEARTAESGVEPPLARSEDQAYLYYRKGAVVMNAIRDLLGEDAVNAALRELLRTEGGPGGLPTAEHLLAQLNAKASPGQRLLIHEWMNEVVMYDLKLVSSSAVRRHDGRFDVDVTVAASKIPERALQETIAIGFFGEDEETLQYLARPSLRTGTNHLRFVLERAPAVATIDPYITRIDRTRFDNTKPVALR